MPLTELNNREPGIHALIVGVSDYTHLADRNNPGGAGTQFGMLKLRTAALSAFNFAQWLKNADAQGCLDRPLASLEVLLAPSAEESTVAGLAAFQDDTTGVNFKNRVRAWRQRVGSSKNNVALFYFAGHGIQRNKDDSVLLLCDFGAPNVPILNSGFAFYDIFNGMAPSDEDDGSGNFFPNMGRTQLYFIDTCRTLPEEIKNFERLQTQNIFDSYLGGRDDRSAPSFFAAANDSSGYGLQGQGSIFSLALIRALNCGAENQTTRGGQAVWPVSARSLATAIELQFKKIKSDQMVYFGGHVGDPIICYLKAPPDVDCSIAVGPDAKRVVATVQMEGLDHSLAWQQPTPPPVHPYTFVVPAGIYRLLVAVSGGQPLEMPPRVINQKASAWEVQLP